MSRGDKVALGAIAVYGASSIWTFGIAFRFFPSGPDWLFVVLIFVSTVAFLSLACVVVAQRAAKRD